MIGQLNQLLAQALIAERSGDAVNLASPRREPRRWSRGRARLRSPRRSADSASRSRRTERVGS
jgi:hypothetical protein